MYIQARGGWDASRVLADWLDHPHVSRERGAERAQIGDLGFIDHPDRPSVRAFFERFASRSFVINGLSVPSIDHDAAAIMSLGGLSAHRAGRATGDWDTHTHNDARQSLLWERLFSNLLRLGPTLSDDTLVVVCSELGRAPTLNAAGGKEHWPFTSALLFGAGLKGGRTVGGWDHYVYGRRVDPASGELDERGARLSVASLAATLATWTGEDPGPLSVDAPKIAGLLA